MWQSRKVKYLPQRLGGVYNYIKVQDQYYSKL